MTVMLSTFTDNPNESIEATTTRSEQDLTPYVFNDCLAWLTKNAIDMMFSEGIDYSTMVTVFCPPSQAFSKGSKTPDENKSKIMAQIGERIEEFEVTKALKNAGMLLRVETSFGISHGIQRYRIAAYWDNHKVTSHALMCFWDVVRNYCRVKTTYEDHFPSGDFLYNPVKFSLGSGEERCFNARIQAHLRQQDFEEDRVERLSRTLEQDMIWQAITDPVWYQAPFTFKGARKEFIYQSLVRDNSFTDSYVFVYGSLKEGLGNHSLLENSHKIGKYVTVEPYCLKDLGEYPGVLQQPRVSPIKGELYRLNDITTLALLDHLEGNPTFYRRKVVKVRKIGGVVTYVAWMYFLQDEEQYEPLDTIESGVW